MCLRHKVVCPLKAGFGEGDSISSVHLLRNIAPT